MAQGERLLYEIAIRPLYFIGREPFVAAVLNVRTTRLFERTAAELMRDGLCMEGVYVVKAISSGDPRIAPRFHGLGCVRSVRGSLLELTDARPEIEAVEASEVWPAKDFFTPCLHWVLKENAPGIAVALEHHRAALRQGSELLKRIRKVLDALQKRSHYMVPGLPFTFGPLLNESLAEFPSVAMARRPVYVFNAAGSNTDTWHDRGLNKFGPYTASVQTFASPRICVICQHSQRGQVDQFLRKFFFHGLESIPPEYGQRKSAKNYFETGFCRKYAVKTVHYEFFLVDGTSADAYRKACQAALETQGNGQRWDLALVQIEEPFHQLPPESNPYFAAKLSFLGLQVPVQQFEIETTRKWDSQLSFA